MAEMITDGAGCEFHRDVAAIPGWFANDPAQGAHRYYADDWTSIATPTADGHWRGMAVHGAAVNDRLIHDIRAIEYFDDPANAMRWADEEVARHRRRFRESAAVSEGIERRIVRVAGALARAKDATGWALGLSSATDLFETAWTNLRTAVVPDERLSTCKTLIEALENDSWDGQLDVLRTDWPEVRSAMEELHPDWQLNINLSPAPM
jgi:hypothetical protein